MVTRALTLCLLVAGAMAAAAAKQPTFADWLAVKSADPTKKAGTSAASPAYEYEEVETEEQCLRAVSQNYCDLPHFTLQWSSGLACCNGKHYSKASNTFLTQPEEVGTCDYTVHPRYDVQIPVKENVKQVASFTATCTLHQNSDECGYPFCDKMVLSIQGQVYEVANAIVSSLPDAPVRTDGTCDEIYDDGVLPKQESPLQKEFRELRSKHPLFRSAKNIAPAKAAYAPDHEYDHPQLYKVNSATMYYGSMVVVSREHNVKSQIGWFEHVSRIDAPANPNPVTYAQAGGHYVLDPYVYKLTFIKNKGY